MQISPDVLPVLEQLEVNGSRVRIVQRLPRNLYLKVSAVLNNAGGKWNGKTKTHFFPGNASEIIQRLLANP
jgi:hypothetical protein